MTLFSALNDENISTWYSTVLVQTPDLVHEHARTVTLVGGLT